MGVKYVPEKESKKDIGQINVIQLTISNIFYTPKITNLRFLISDGYCHHMPDNYMILPIDEGPSEDNKVN